MCSANYFVTIHGLTKERTSPWSAYGFNVSIVWLERLDDWAASVVTSLTDETSRDSHEQKLYTDTYQRLGPLALELLTGNVGVFVEYCNVEEFVSNR